MKSIICKCLNKTIEINWDKEIKLNVNKMKLN